MMAHPRRPTATSRTALPAALAVTWRSGGGRARAMAIKRRASKRYRAHARAEIRSGQHG